jgi:hypothetical protein
MTQGKILTLSSLSVSLSIIYLIFTIDVYIEQVTSIVTLSYTEGVEEETITNEYHNACFKEGDSIPCWYINGENKATYTIVEEEIIIKHRGEVLCYRDGSRKECKELYTYEKHRQELK